MKKKTFKITLDMPPKISEKDKWDGWTNSATWCAELYFFQERIYYEECKRLIEKDGKLDRQKFVFLWNRFTQDPKVSQVDSTCNGPIYVEEICRFFEDRVKRGEC